MNPDTIECVWTGEFDLNTLLVDGEMFESGKKKLRIQYVWTELKPLFGDVLVHRCCRVLRKGLKISCVRAH